MELYENEPDLDDYMDVDIKCSASTSQSMETVMEPMHIQSQPKLPQPRTTNNKTRNKRWLHLSLLLHVLWLVVALTLLVYVIVHPIHWRKAQDELTAKISALEGMLDDMKQKAEDDMGELREREAAELQLRLDMQLERNETAKMMDELENKEGNLLNSVNETWQSVYSCLSKTYCPLTLGTPTQTLSVYEQDDSTINYLYQTHLPAMSQFTTCFWFKGKQDDRRSNAYLVNIVNQDRDQLHIGWYTSGKLTVSVQGSGGIMEGAEKLGLLWVGWNKHCFTWRAGEKCRWYTDAQVSGKLDLIASADVTDKTILGNGYITLLQEQDRIGGNFNPEQTVQGRIAEFNMWDYEMNSLQINTQTCGSEGNVASWDLLLRQGPNEMTSDEFPACDAEVRNLTVFTQEQTTTDYLYQSDLPGMSELTICFWYSGEYDDDRVSDYFVSIATESQPNEFIIGWSAQGNLEMEIKRYHFSLDALSDEEEELFWVNWHKHCFTYKAGETFKWYTDRDGNGRLDLIASTDVTSESILSGGHMVILQEQDSFGGGLDASQVAVGKLAEFNMWDYEMNIEQINYRTCGKKGSVASMDSLQIHGSTEYGYEDFPMC